MTKKQTLLMVLVVLVIAVGAAAFLSGGELMGLVFKKNPVLVVSLAADTPVTSILVAGDTNQPVAKFKLAAADDQITIDSLSLNCIGDGSLAGSADNNISTVQVSSGNISKTSFLTNGVVSFGGLKLVVPKDDNAVLNVNVTLNTIPGGATSGEYFHFSMGDIKAFGTSSRTPVGVEKGEKGGFQESKNMYVYETKPSLTLDATSPSGSKTVSASDKVLTFNVGTSNKEKLIIEKIGFSLYSDADFALNSSITAYLLDAGVRVASGTINVIGSSQAEAELLPVGILEIPKGTTATYSLVLDSAGLLEEDAGTDDPLSICLKTSIDPNVEGGFWWNDTNSTVKWVDKLPLGNSTLCGNTLKY